MSRLRDAEESNRNTELWGESQSGGSRRQQRYSFFEETIDRNHRNPAERSRARTQPEVDPMDVLETEPHRGRSRQGATVAGPSMHPSSQRQPLDNVRSDRLYHPYKSSGRDRSRREESSSFLSAPNSDERMARLFRECVQREQRDRGIGARVTSPFTRNIETAITAREWKMPTMEPYKGTSDPIVHLQRYTQHMLMSGATEECCINAFHYSWQI